MVTAYSAEFNAEEVFANERSAVIAHLPSLEDQAARAFFEAPTAGVVQTDLAAMEDDKEEENAEAGPSGKCVCM